MRKILPSFILFVFVACEKESDSLKSDKCSLTPDPGFCEAYIPRYYFDKNESKCKEFIWGGCDGVVPFETLEECKEHCGCEPAPGN